MGVYSAGEVCHMSKIYVGLFHASQCVKMAAYMKILNDNQAS